VALTKTSAEFVCSKMVASLETGMFDFGLEDQKANKGCIISSNMGIDFFMVTPYL
jgi:hypothetical protein